MMQSPYINLNRRLQIILFFIFFIKYTSTLNCQIPFDLFIEESHAYGGVHALYCEENTFYAVGNTGIAWVGRFDYKGNTDQFNIIDSSNTLDAYIPPRLAVWDIFLNSKNNLLIYGSRQIGFYIYTPKLIEFDLNEGKVVRSIILYPPAGYPVNNTHELTLHSMIVKDSVIILTSFFSSNYKYQYYVVYLDTEFNIINEFVVSDPVSNNVVSYVTCENDTTITLVGDSNGKPFIYRLKNNGDSLYFKTFDKFYQNSISFSPTYANTVRKDDSNNWIISCLTRGFPIPITFKLDSNFENLLWLQTIPGLSRSQPTSMIKCSDNSGFITAGFGGPGFIYKVSNTGDLLWLRKIIPMDWSEERASLIEIADLKETPHGNLLLCGRVFDKALDEMWSWIVQLDKHGCYTPGCHIADKNDNNKNHFVVYPNPSSQELSLLTNLIFTSPVLVNLISSNGIVLKSKEFIPAIDTYYLFSIDDLPRGTYYISIIGEMENLKEIHPFVKQ